MLEVIFHKHIVTSERQDTSMSAYICVGMSQKKEAIYKVILSTI